MNRVFAAALGCALALSSIAAAPPAKPPAAKPAGTKLVPIPNSPPLGADDPAKVALARQFIVAFHPRLDPKNIKKGLDVFIPRAVAIYKKRDPKFDAKKYDAETRDRVLKGAAKKIELQSHIISRHFTADELKGLIAFFKGPLGAKLVVETPKIQMDMLQIRREIGEQTKGSSYKKDGADDEDEDEDDAPAKMKPAPAKPQPKK
jgi:hypothetical protein